MQVNTKALYFYKIITIIFVLLTIFGMYISYSPVPHMDMWDGYLDFYTRISDGEWQKWFAQHNEHRIVFSRILFYLDIEYFSGYSWFLLIVNFILMLVTAMVFTFIIKDLYTNNSQEEYIKNTKSFLILFLILVSFSWVQRENITWGFQSQFFSAYLFPLISFYLIVKSKHEENNNLFFFLALSFGVFSMGTMANGIMALPVLLLLMMVLRLNPIKIILTALTTALFLYLYFANYSSPGGHTSVSDTLVNHPVAFFKYLFAYLGGIFYYFTGKGSIVVAQLAGVFLLLSAFFFTYLAILKKRNIFYFVALGFLLYFGGTAFGTAGGRAFMGIEQAFSSRYMTPTMIAWGLVAILWMDHIKNNKKITFRVVVFLSVLSTLLFAAQVRVYKVYNPSYILNKKVATLAFEMNVRDEEYIMHVFPFVDWVRDMVKKPKETNISIFNHEDIKDVEKLIGTKTLVDLVKTQSTNGLIFSSNKIKEDKNFLRVSGEIGTKSSNLILVNEEKIVIGYALTGQIDGKSKYIGYVNLKLIGKKNYIFDKDLNKVYQITLNK